ncbi:helix-turn-helix domain-containing protein [Nocardia puris]|uniref:helix-turn-helix domain-containing protein n=1 Tax=Nocardia puris TaxID=208602 RepID=UPI002B4B8D2E|nr:XRE family transcriptional regulator [Nocardia puris]
MRNRTMVDESLWAEIGDRVRESRLAAGFSQGELAQRVGLERSKITKIEAGARQISAVELTRLATELGMPLGDFLHARPKVISQRTPLVDDTNSPTAQVSYRVEAVLAAWLRDVRDVLGFGSWKPPSLLRYPGSVETADDARGVANWTRKQLGLDRGPIETMMSVCEKAGQLVLVVDVPGDGASLIEDDLAVAVVSSTRDPGRRRATAAHELGHMVLGDEYSSDLGGGVASARRDREAVIDAFAAELLLPVAAIRQSGPPTGDPRAYLIELAARYRTSWTLAIRQAIVAGLIDPSDEVCWLSSSKPTHAEIRQAVEWTPPPDFDRVRVPPGYADAVLTAWTGNLITVARVIELMHGQVTRDDLGVEDDSADEP